MSKKENFWTQVISAMNGAMTFGGLSPSGDVRSSIELQGADGRHFIDLSEDGVREGWTTINAPGAIQINAGEDLEKDQHGIFINTENGDIILRAKDGRIRIEGTDVEIVASNNFLVNAVEAVKIDSKNITIDAVQSLKLLTTGALTIDGKLATQILSPIVHAITCATDPEKKPGEI